MRGLPLAAMVLLAGCITPLGSDQASRSSPDIARPAVPPPILMGESAQGHAIVVLGVECCNLTWASVSITPSGDVGCDVHAPSSGPIMAGENIQALLPAPDSQCSYSVTYEGLNLGDFLFAPDIPADQPLTVTQTVTQAHPSNATQPQGGNGTVPPA